MSAATTTLNPVFKPLERLRMMLKIDGRDISHVYIYALLIGLINLSLPLGLQGIVNMIQGAEVSRSWIVLVSVVLGGLLLTGLLQILQLRIVENISQRIFTRASFEFGFRFPKIKFNSLYNYYGPELANRFFDTITIQKSLPKILIDFSLALFQILAGLIVLSLYHPFFILFALSLVTVVYIILIFSGPRGLRTSLEESKYKYEVAHWLEEIARTRHSFKLVNNPGIVLEKVDETVQDYLQARENHFRILIGQYWGLLGFKIFISAGLLIIGSLLVFQQEMNIGQFVAAEIIILLIINSIEKLIKSLDTVYDILTALEKIGYVADMDLEPESGFEPATCKHGIEFDLAEVSFGYPDSPSNVLSELNLQIPKGQSLLVSGTGGSGKSTLISMISGMLKPTQGKLYINGNDLQSINPAFYRAQIGFATNNNEIFKGTVYQNISLSRPEIHLDNVNRAVEITGLANDIRQLPDGLHTELEPEGRKIPKSTVQKILLARAIAADPPVLLLEDPLASIADSEKARLIGALMDSRPERTLIVSSNDPIWKDFVERTITLKHGNIISDHSYLTV